MSMSRTTMRRFPPAAAVVVALLLVTFGPTAFGTSASQRSFPSHLAALRSSPDADSLATLMGARRQEGSQLTVDAFEQDQRAFPATAIPADGYVRGVRQADRVGAPSRAVVWKQLGPTFAPNANSSNPVSGNSTPVSGRVTALAVVPSTCGNGECRTMYLGTATGGVWKTVDAGQTWKPITDHAQTLAVGTIVLDPKNSNIVYVGTGEANHSSDSFRGVGILRSLNAGRTWTTIGARQFVNRAVAAIVIDPRSAGSANATIYAVSTRAASGGATTGGAAARTNPNLPTLGFYASRNGGKTWQVSTPAPDGAQSLVMDPSDPNILYAGFNPDVNDPSHGGSPQGLFGFTGLFKSVDDGKNWIRLTKGLPLTDFDTIQLAVAPSDPNIVYASFKLTAPDGPFSSAGGASAHEAMYKSTDAGATWSELTNTPNACGDQCEYDNPVVVDPTNPDVVYVGGTANYSYWGGERPECGTFYPLPTPCQVTVMKTTDGGKTWADISENGNGGPLHPDDHVIVLAPNDPGVVYTGNDGGIFHSADGGKSWKDLNRGLGTLQFTGLALAPDGSIYAGTQDNGTFKYTGSPTWRHIESGDGGPTGADPKNANIVYKSLYGPLLLRNDHGGDPNADVFIAPFYGDYAIKGLGQFYEPYIIAPSHPSTIYYGTYRIWRSNLRGGVDSNNDGDVTNDPQDKNDWVPISFDLRCGSQLANPGATCTGGPTFGHGIASIAVSPVTPNVLVAGASDGRIWLTTNAQASVKTDSSCSTLNNPYGVALCDYVSGVTWRRIDKTLPGRYPTSIAFAPGSSTTIYITFSGFDQNTPSHKGHVFMSTDRGQTWHDIDGVGAHSALPDLPFNSIVINPVNLHLYVAADHGVFASTNGGHSWQRIDTSLPSAPVYQMQYSTRRHTVVVATHGRGIWEVAAP